MFHSKNAKNDYINVITTTRFISNTHDVLPQNNKRNKPCCDDIENECLKNPPPPPLTLDENNNNCNDSISSQKSNSSDVDMVKLRWRAINITNLQKDVIWSAVTQPKLSQEFIDAFSCSTKTIKKIIIKKQKKSFLDTTAHRTLSIFFKKHTFESLISCITKINSNKTHASDNDDNAIDILPLMYTFFQKSGDIFKKISEYLKCNSIDDLDEVDHTLYKLYNEPDFAERAEIMFKFKQMLDSLNDIEEFLNERLRVFQHLLNSNGLKDILGIILSCGNMLNANDKWLSNDVKSFDIEILSRLKEIKTKKYGYWYKNLLEFVVYHYFNENKQREYPLPLPGCFSHQLNYTSNTILKYYTEEKKNFKQLQESLEHKNNNDDFDLYMSTQVQSLSDRLKYTFDKINDSNELHAKCQVNFCYRIKQHHIHSQPQLQLQLQQNHHTDAEFVSIWKLFAEDFYKAWKDLIKTQQHNNNNTAKRMKTE